jgi:hypothetical protein
VLPGHEEANASANIWRGDDERFVYRDHHARDGREAYQLVEVYAFVRAGRFFELTARTVGRWKLRLCHELGMFTAPTVRLPALPPGASSDARMIREGFALLCALRWASSDWDPTPYTRKFAGPWCGVSTHRAEAALGENLSAGVFTKVDEHPIGNGSMALYAPGQLRADCAVRRRGTR